MRINKHKTLGEFMELNIKKVSTRYDALIAIDSKKYTLAIVEEVHDYEPYYRIFGLKDGEEVLIHEDFEALCADAAFRKHVFKFRQAANDERISYGEFH